ncbi:MAG TPA: ATPase, T2SS/T4P/T4SS family [Burkholderiales bacterium]|nr:ATPase, T2SS/T4P/T4SS family [Burkholderiales bacterium]
MNSMVLTGIGGEYELSKALREKMVLLMDGTIYVNENYKNDIDVLNKITFFCNINDETGDLLTTRDKIKYTIPEVIRGFYEEDSANAFSDGASQMQREIINLIQIAHQKNASDIHIELNASSTFIMFRILGDLVLYKTLTYDSGNLMCTTLYNTMTTTSGTNFNSRVQQDANIQEAFLPKELSGIRVATGPTQGENYFIVLRLLPKGANSTLEDIGYSKFQLKYIRDFKAVRNGGIVIFSGPTGSGKSTSLQAMNKETLKEYKGRINLISIEDPVEYPIVVEDVVEGKKVFYSARQIAVPSTQDKELRKQYFNNAVVAAMRQDPDVIMIGEIRDPITAEAAITASITGHPVASTVHASNAIMIIDRLITIGANRKLLLAPGTLSGLISQQLVPILCPKCKKSLISNLPDLEKNNKALVTRLLQAFDNDLTNIFIRGKGCNYYDSQTKQSCIYGHIDRTVVAEIVVPDEMFLQYLRQDDLFNASKYWLEEQKGVTMMCHGLAKVKSGLIDPRALEAKLKLITPQKNLDRCLNDY